jgi:glyceraldehyde-3-phosphate dehydrogenase (NADP+)
MRTVEPLVAGAWQASPRRRTITSPYDGAAVADAGLGDAAMLQSSLDAAVAAREPMARLPGHRRAAILDAAADEVSRRRDELASVLLEEAGKPLALARVEVDRSVDTLTESARVARSTTDELLDLGGAPSGVGRTGWLRRFPVGVVAGITPFNFPLNLVAHKLGPAVAAGCPIVLKPASQTPTAALVLGDILARAGLPEGAISVVPMAGHESEALYLDERVRMLSFTGSAEVGWALRRKLWDRRVTLELGGNAAVIVEPDAGDLAGVAQRVALGAFAFAGQSCISVQRILVHRAVASQFLVALDEAAVSFPTGDPAASDVLCGPLITAADADRVESWVDEAISRGARVRTPRRRAGSIVHPVILENVPPDSRVWADEVFGPVAAVRVYESYEAALELVNDSRYGLQAGLFTRDIEKIQHAFATLEVGAVIQGDIPSWRSDPMPYGGVKASGLGREGPRWAVEEMTEPRLLVLRQG